MQDILFHFQSILKSFLNWNSYQLRLSEQVIEKDLSIKILMEYIQIGQNLFFRKN